jgi:phospholipase/carboxylesterase
MRVPLSLVHVVREPDATASTLGASPPLLLLLHGVGSNEQSMASLAPAFDPRFIVVSARSPIALGPNAFAWFHVQFTPRGPVINAAEAKEGWTRVASFIDEAVNAYGADRTRVYVAGFSQGAIMALATLLTAPDRIAGVAAMSGRLLPEVLPHAAPAAMLIGKPVLLVHGTLDEKLGVHYARSAREQLAKFPLTLSYRELPIGHAVTQESVSIVGRWLSELLDAPRRAQPEESESLAREADVDHALEMTFPASDPPAWMSSGSPESD